MGPLLKLSLHPRPSTVWISSSSSFFPPLSFHPPSFHLPFHQLPRWKLGTRLIFTCSSCKHVWFACNCVSVDEFIVVKGFESSFPNGPTIIVVIATPLITNKTQSIPNFLFSSIKEKSLILSTFRVVHHNTSKGIQGQDSPAHSHPGL